jgi:hypothetical protein
MKRGDGGAVEKDVKFGLPGMPGDLAGVVRVDHGGRVHGAAPDSAAAGSVAGGEEEEEGGEEERHGDGWGSPRPRPRHGKRECHRGLARSRSGAVGAGRGARRGLAVTSYLEMVVTRQLDSGQGQRVGTRRGTDLGRPGTRIRRSDGQHGGEKRARTLGSSSRHGQGRIIRGTHRENVRHGRQTGIDLSCQKIRSNSVSKQRLASVTTSGPRQNGKLRASPVVPKASPKLIWGAPEKTVSAASLKPEFCPVPESLRGRRQRHNKF